MEWLSSQLLDFDVLSGSYILVHALYGWVDMTDRCGGLEKNPKF